MARETIQQDALFAALADQIKLPLTQIRHAAAMDYSESTGLIDTTAEAALKLIDGYLLALQMQSELDLQLEPVSISSLLYDVASQLRPYAAFNHCEIELSVAGKYGPVIARREALLAALSSLGYAFIGASGASKTSRKVIRLGVSRNSVGLTAGVFSSNSGLNQSLLKTARRLAGKAHQTMPGFSSESGVGVLIADRLFETMDTTMRISRLGGMQGLAATLSPSRQLTLV